MNFGMVKTHQDDEEPCDTNYKDFGTAKTHLDDDESYNKKKDPTHRQSCKRSGLLEPSSFGLINEVVPLKNYDERQCSDSWLHHKIISERKNDDEDWKSRVLMTSETNLWNLDKRMKALVTSLMIDLTTGIGFLFLINNIL